MTKGQSPLSFKAVLFDFDGTLTKPESLNLSLVKKEIGCPADQYVLEFINRLPPGSPPLPSPMKAPKS